MSRFTVNTNRFDPYKNFKFRIIIGGKTVAGLNSIYGLGSLIKKTKAKKKRKMPGMQKFSNVTLKRGFSLKTDFKKHIGSILVKNIAALSSGKHSEDIVLKCYDEKNKVTAAYRLHNAWVSKLSSPGLNAKGNEVEIESIQLSYEAVEIETR